MNLLGKVALVTGGGSGIGQAIALELHRRGASVMVTDIDTTSIATTMRLAGESSGMRGIRSDVTVDREARACVIATLEAFGKLDIAVNSAGAGPREWVPLYAVSEADWDQLMNLNVKGVWLSMKHQWPALTRPGGVIINIASVSGSRGDPGCGALSPSKHAVIGLTRTAAAEGLAEGLRVNAISPASVLTPARHESPQALARIVADAPYQRLISVEEVAAAAAYLASDAAAYINGADLVIDGGLSSVLA